MDPSPGQRPRNKLMDARRGLKDLVLNFYAGVEEAVPRESGQKRKKKDRRDVLKWENIRKEITYTRY